MREMSRRKELAARKTGGSNVLPYLIASGIGAAAMYFFDPSRGRRRRRLMADKVNHAAHVAAETAAATRRDLANRARGLVASARRPFISTSTDDSVIRERVRAELGHVVSHPRSVEVHVEEGRVALTGSVLEDEAADLVSHVAKVRGVVDVADNLVRHPAPESVYVGPS